ncbi:acid protease [Cubamyces lactineus]|nr:acid protease [Cubamyces lactineus]
MEISCTTLAAIHLPIRRNRGHLWKRGGQAAAVVGVGDDMDVTYNIQVQVGGITTPLIIDTGSSDLWILCDGCKDHCPITGVPLYSQASFTPTGQNIQLLYGDSRTGTHATGMIGTDTVSIAEMSVPGQYFAAVVDTNTTVLETGSAGILGLGFPPTSLIWRQLLASQSQQAMPSLPKRSMLDRRDSSLANPVDSFPTLGPLLTRLVTWKVLERPLVVATLQRDTISFSSNDGTLSLGALPFGLSDDLLTWVPVRTYTVAEGGLPPPPDAPNEVYPLVWEVLIGDVFFDGAKVPRSTLSPPSFGLSALIDTGNSLIRGPQDVLAYIYSRLNLDSAGTFDCANAHNLTFIIGGTPFAVDPRDFAHPAVVVPGTRYPDEAARCTPALAATDPPGAGGFLYSWSLGDPFLKSTMTAFYYGNMTHPSQDPARIGFMSMVPSDATSALEEAVDAAIADGGVFLSTSEPAPYATALRLAGTMASTADEPRMTQGSPRASSRAVPRLCPGASLWMYALMIVLYAGVLADVF